MENTIRCLLNNLLLPSSICVEYNKLKNKNIINKFSYQIDFLITQEIAS